MLIKNYKNTFFQELSPLYEEKEVESFFYLVLESFHRKKRIDLALYPEMEMDALQLLRWESVLVELKKHKPIQYILGETEFFGLPFLVNENVLIPRPETEELVDLILSNIRISELPNLLKILDIGTGSGCIPIALKKNLPNAEVYAIDVSEKALATAQKNAELNTVAVQFMLKNILETVDLEQQFDIIVSNPPYVQNLEKAEINPNVLEYEPHLALFVEDHDALLFYRKITELAKKNLNPNGKLYFEINQYLGKETVVLIERFGFKNVTLIKDIYGNDRMISAVL
ncbi:peptide chain release factor N(5)-glutamine methyltransferase [Flavobacterium sp. J49]|uniref:peptide chain release factor N(5)-glutamine methyltransferase n=1 Tax=Flavobacterium sp. J49 TaxID=2718534 RepID=UPI00159400D0|nr:peptide chain release factor N(5)-glutamine methyltransferase [Flavobacterium sp. J49]MBF6641059.1 peptide chain release factor N(5)-glutamine methyltransferase [Flavobacterium sp. J49]NIC02306.1 peptide chain release factor N(5)-glutamine methyltransferase [Flavobacterium sp. J49]